jgi:hypothetical protein
VLPNQTGKMMKSLSSNDLWERISAYLNHQRTCVISTTAAQGVWAIPVLFRPCGNPNMEMDCLVPRWSDVAHYLTQYPKVVVTVHSTSGARLNWLQIQANAIQLDAPDWNNLLPSWVSTLQPEELYLAVRTTPNRIDLIDENQGWGIQDTLEW